MAYKQAITASDKASWLKWFETYGADQFLEAFIRTAQYAEGHCVHCHQAIYLDVIEGGGVPDWRTEDGDYGCFDSPDTNENGTGGHSPRMLKS